MPDAEIPAILPSPFPNGNLPLRQAIPTGKCTIAWKVSTLPHGTSPGHHGHWRRDALSRRLKAARVRADPPRATDGTEDLRGHDLPPQRYRRLPAPAGPPQEATGEVTARYS